MSVGGLARSVCCTGLSRSLSNEGRLSSEMCYMASAIRISDSFGTHMPWLWRKSKTFLLVSESFAVKLSEVKLWKSAANYLDKDLPLYCWKQQFWRHWLKNVTLFSKDSSEGSASLKHRTFLHHSQTPTLSILLICALVSEAQQCQLTLTGLVDAPNLLSGTTVDCVFCFLHVWLEARRKSDGGKEKLLC